MTQVPEPSAPNVADEAHDPSAPELLGPLSAGITVGFVPGVMPGKWFDRWDDRFSRSTPLTRLPVGAARGVETLEQERAHMVLARPDDEPKLNDRDRFHTVKLYEETMVVVLPIDHVLTLLDTVPLEELSEEFMLQRPESIPEWASIRATADDAEPQKLPPMRDTADAVELVAAGIGLLIVPMSLARHHHRKDVTFRPVDGMRERPVVLAWPRDLERPEPDEAILQEFVGVVRGRTSASSRGGSTGRSRKDAGANAQRPAAVTGKPGRASSNRTKPKPNRPAKSRRGSTRGSRR
ncbi:LysR substrate-binding domain-containing protein [Kocuria massiliensis]|uniref:LysR substrate-binding domain-containing protein n=1 Tax=Kocuria massiliensis TaxID=1926282 RepID=UPI000A1CC4A5|nr:LysR substrate-binding domain-containing protein [Kocuria massiliensis]